MRKSDVACRKGLSLCHELMYAASGGVNEKYSVEGLYCHVDTALPESVALPPFLRRS